eukprot:scaffold5198_cov173-Amphora_coffeaeformis.AAC.7
MADTRHVAVHAGVLRSCSKVKNVKRFRLAFDLAKYWSNFYNKNMPDHVRLPRDDEEICH